MELLLNLAWVLLALPAYWLWRDCSGVSGRRRPSSLQCLLALGCMLVILFPVVSATDDLHAMRSEMEESPCSKRSVTQRSAEKATASKWQHQPMLAAVESATLSHDETWYFVPVVLVSTPSAQTFTPVGRAPPVSFLA